MENTKQFKKVSLKLLRALYNFGPKSEKHNDFTISDLKLLLFLTDYKNKCTEVRYTFICNNSGIKGKKLL